MHEFSITSSIIDILNNIINDRDIKKIIKINFYINSYGGIEPESIRFYFEYLTKDSKVFKGSKLIFKKEKIKITCNDCGECFEVSKLRSTCRKCASSNISVLFPEDIRIKSIEI